jgi:ribosomal protein L7/L12
LAPVAELLFRGEKIAAIKLYREQVKPGAGLKESKEAVEQLEAGLRAQHPEKFTAKAKSGCATLLATLAMLAMILVALVWARL